MIPFYDLNQGTEEWFAIRSGIPTGSEFKRFITPAKGDYASAADEYAAELVASSLGWSKSFKGNSDTDRGNLLEAEAIRWLAFRHGFTGRNVGFCLSDCGWYGASPDWLMDDGTPVEVKAPDLHTLIKWKLKGELPQDHKVQKHREIFTTGAKRGIFVAYSENPYVENMMVEVPRDDFTEKVGACLKRFLIRLKEIQVQMTGEEAEFLFKSKLPSPC